MYQIEPYKPRIRLVGNDGSVVDYTCWEDFLDRADYWFLNGHLVDKFNDPRDKITLDWYFIDLARRLPRRVHYIIRDESGSVFSRNEVVEAVAEHNKVLRYQKFSWFYNHYNFIYRETPVPYTRKRRRHKGSFYRRPKTTQEKRLGYEDTEYVRGKRRPHMLPDAWEDMPRFRTKSWKKYRKTQYK